ncbi:MAG: hypothetical protein R3E79_57735 [Caldilineaceae bacterium]
MVELTLIAPGEQALKPLVEAALMNEQRMLEMGLRKTQQRLQRFETQYGLSTAEFVANYRNDLIQETVETIEWLGEYRMAQRIQAKIDTLKAIHFAN